MKGKALVLIVEDDMDISNMLRDLLENNGYEVKAAFSGTEALLQAQLNRFDLVLLDLMLPGLPGEDVVKALREKQDLIVIALSAKNDQKPECVECEAAFHPWKSHKCGDFTRERL